MKNNYTLLFILVLASISAQAQTYCLPTYAVDGCNCPGTWDHIESFWTTGGQTDIANINSACTGVLPNNYTYFANQTVTASAGQTFSINVQGGTAAGGCTSQFPHGFRVWVDWNSDGDFDDPGEDAWNSVQAGMQVFTGTITVPAFATGTMRMRVRSAYAMIPDDPCGVETYGECEDYNISTDLPSPCSGQPNAGYAANSTLQVVNTGNTIVLATDSMYTTGGGVTYQWMVNDGSGWQNIGPTTNMPNLNAGSPNSPITFVTGQTDTAEYQLVVTCTNSGLSDTTLPTTVLWEPIDYCNTTITAYAGLDSTGSMSPTTIQFNASNLSMSGSFEWNFGDGTTQAGWGWTSHTYAEAGSYNVCVVYTDSFYMCADTTCVDVIIDSFATVTGTVFLDLNQNGVQDGGEPGIANQQISNPYSAWTNYTYTDANGDYTAYVIPGAVDISYNMSPTVVGGWSFTTPNPLTVQADTANFVYPDNDFGVHVDSGYVDVGLSIWCVNTVPGFTGSAQAALQNNGLTANTLTVTLHYDTLLSYDPDGPGLWWWGNAILPTDVDTNNHVITFNLTILPGEITYLAAGLYCPGGTPLGTPVYNWASVSVIGASDANSTNDTSFCQTTVVGSFDPNEKSVNPAGVGDVHAINPNHVDELTYTVQFQNTGTYLATNVRIADTLDAVSLDVPSLRFISSSHPCEIDITEGNIMEARFDNIMLPDSNSNEPASHGYVTFAVKLNTGLSNFHVVANSAAIYFDFNEPVITHTTFVTLDQNLSSHEIVLNNDYTLYPNPVDQLMQLVYVGNGTAGNMYTLTDVTGRVLSGGAVSPDGGATVIDVSDFTNGLYCVNVVNSNGTSVTKRFTVLHR